MNDGIRSSTWAMPCTRADGTGRDDDREGGEPAEVGQPHREEDRRERAQRGDRQVDAAAQDHQGGAGGEDDQRCRGADRGGEAALGQEVRVGDGQRREQRDERDDRHERRDAAGRRWGAPVTTAGSAAGLATGRR